MDFMKYYSNVLPINHLGAFSFLLYNKRENKFYFYLNYIIILFNLK